MFCWCRLGYQLDVTRPLSGRCWSRRGVRNGLTRGVYLFLFVRGVVGWIARADVVGPCDPGWWLLVVGDVA